MASTPLGLTLGFFKHFVELHGGRDAFQGLSTADICTTFVMPYTASTQLSLVEHVHANHPRSKDYAKPASWFVSHAWSYLFLDVVDALDAFFNEQGLPGNAIAVWFCMFNNNQHQIADQIKEFSFWVDSFQTALKAIGNVVMVLSPWNNPTTLTRTWCVFEIYVAIVTNARFEVAMGKTQKQSFLDDIQDDNGFYKMLGSIKSENSHTAMASDRNGICDQLQQANLEFADLDRMLLQVLEAWMVRTMQRQIDGAATNLADKARWLFVLGKFWSDKNVRDQAQTCFEEAIRIHRDKLQCTDPAAWKVVMYLGVTAQVRGQPRSVWEPLFQEALTHQTDQLGTAHPDTLDTMVRLGMRYLNLGQSDHGRGMQLLTESFETSRRVFGADHVKTLNAMAGVARGHLIQNHLSEAEMCIQECLERTQRTLGDEFPMVNVLEDYLAFCYSRRGKYDLATMIFQHIYKKRLRIKGPDHLDTTGSYCCVGEMYQRQGQYDQAARILLECLETADRMALSPMHAYIFSARLGFTYLCSGDIDQSNKYLTHALDGLTTLQGPKSNTSQMVLYWRCLLQMTTNGYMTLPLISDVHAQLIDADCFHETWLRALCHGCYLPIRGQLFTCWSCPKFAWWFCRSCVASEVSTFCDHGQTNVVAFNPPARFVQEKRLELLAREKDWRKYGLHYEAYNEYCTKFEVPEEEQMKNGDENLAHRMLVSKWFMLGMLASVVVLSGWRKI
ncbi:Aste57867_8586 [Aphanomyces stellatus]|uniref:Aste57867_8586 protein n=1 Tax=Aphanomyces stellatus TaxID=120398 RepID=A0A485KKQ7_9STRA|nr:hypothetical protein As57867_008554 [Aphanomyces stellatus]VFT85472.1 Aste57867_8586 [Aphanomyces stellatus]